MLFGWELWVLEIAEGLPPEALHPAGPQTQLSDGFRRWGATEDCTQRYEWLLLPPLMSTIEEKKKF